MPHALIVEDDLNARAALEELVRTAGFTTAVAGKPAWRRASSSPASSPTWC